MATFETFEHERHMRRAIDLAREAADRGDNPFGSVLVRDDEEFAAASNRVVTGSDMRRHPELDLAREAYHEHTPEERARTVMYTSTEPCPMCAGGLRTAGLGQVVYSVEGDELRALTGGGSTVSAGEILEGITGVRGGVLAEEGRAVHEAFGW